MTNKTIKAFARPSTDWGMGNPGMDLRDYFAAQALQGLLAEGLHPDIEKLVTSSYEIADRMMEERKKD